MYYVITDSGFKEQKGIPKQAAFFGFLTMEKLVKEAKELEIPGHIVEQCKSIDTTFRSSMQIQDDFLFGSLTVIDVREMDKSRCQMALFFHESYFLIVPIVDEEGDIKANFDSALLRVKDKYSLEKILYTFLDSFLNGASEALEKVEKQMEIMEHGLVQNRMDVSLNKDIFLLKKKLSVLKNYYEQLIDFGEVLKEDELEIFARDKLKYFRIFTGKAKRMSESVKEVRESLIHLREALDANLEYNLNLIMKVFTVVTTIFLPLTLIVGWYGMNFAYMPELTWKYGYLFVGILCAAVVIICLVFFYKKKLL